MLKNLSISASNLLKSNIGIIQQTRSTFLLKRKWPPGLYKKNGSPAKLRGRNFVYELVEDTDKRKQLPISVILTTYVEGLGVKGDVVSVKPRFAYNKLILPKLGVYHTPENVTKYVAETKTTELVEHSSPYAAKTQSCLEHLLLAVVMNKDTHWTIEPWHIRASLRKAGFHVTDQAITLPDKPISGPDLTLEGKEFYIIVTINHLEKANVRCRIHHWSTTPSERLPYVYEFWKLRSEPVFSEQADILNKLPNRFQDKQSELI